MRPIVLTCLLLTATIQLSAQERVTPVPGDRVWLRGVESNGALDKGIRGTFQGWSGDSLRIQVEGRPVTESVQRTGSSRLFVYGGRTNARARGTAIGGGIGAGIGAIVGFAGGEDCGDGSGYWICFDRSTTAAAGAIVLGGIGAIIGAIAGSASTREVWRRAIDGPAARPIVAPLRHGVGVGVTMALP